MTINLSTIQTLVFLEILQILRNDKNKIARKKIYELHIDKKLDNMKDLDESTKLIINQLNGDFDEIGYLSQEFNISDSLFGLYSDTIRRVWIALQNNIKKEKNERKKNDPVSNQFGDHFRKLAFEAKKYRDKNNLKEPGFTDLRNL